MRQHAGGGCCGDGDEFQLISPYCNHKVFILGLKQNSIKKTTLQDNQHIDFLHF